MVTKRHFGVTKGGEDVYAYTISNGRGISVTVLDYGATLQSVVLAHKGDPVDIVLGYDTIEGYEAGRCYLGATIGRFAGRIPDAVLRLGDDAFPVTANEGKNHLHGGRRGFDRHVWNASAGESAVTFSLCSPDGDEGYPGTLRCAVTYTLTDDTLTVTYRGESYRTTAWNPTNHAYWNLNGHASGDARAHRLLLPADRYVPVGNDLLPSEAEADVLRTRFDFRALRPIEDAYDHCFLLNGGPILLIGERGIGMEITTSCAAVQFYNAEFLSGPNGKDGAVYRPFGAVCLEAQGRQTPRGAAVFPENILSAGVPKARTTQFRFLSKED